MPEQFPQRAQLETLGHAGVTSTQIGEVGKELSDDISAAEANLGGLLGLDEQGKAAISGLANQLTTVISELEKGIGHIFPLFDRISLSSVFQKPTEGASDQLASTIQAYESFLHDAQTRILSRLDWWRKESQSGGRAALLLRAAQHYSPESEECPVCGQSVQNLSVKEDLKQLQFARTEWQRGLSDFFRDLSSELDAIVGPALTALGETAPSERIKQDWTRIRDQVAGPLLNAVTQRFEARVLSIADGLEPLSRSTVTLFADGAEKEFREAGANFLDRALKAQSAIEVLRWSQRAHLAALDALEDVTTAMPADPEESLLSALSKGRQAAEGIRPLAAVREQLRIHYKDCSDQELKEKEITLLDQLETPIDRLKALSKYAAEEVAQIFEPLRSTTIENLKKLYPECPNGLIPARLHMGKGKDKSVESLLSSGACEAPAQYFANAGLQRAIALSFLFALLDSHPRGLGFLLMDDPLLSLDEEHRESWSSTILCPCMEKLQVVVATHQRQYLNGNREHFRKGRIVELNPRVRPGTITWRPGNRLERAALELSRAPTNAPNELRKYREEVLATLDAYSPQSFFDSNNFTDSLQRYRRFSPPHPLASAGQNKIVERLTKQEVERVLNPGSHAMSESDVTAAMIQQCIETLRTCDNVFGEELDRLERLRKHTMRRSSIAAAAIPFPAPLQEATWEAPIRLRLLGSAAARPESMTVVPDGVASVSEVPPANAVLVSGPSLDPVARIGQWVLLAQEEQPLRDGDLAAISPDNGRRFLRRVWSDGENWILQSINPVTPIASVVVRKLHAAVRRVIGVLYEPSKIPGSSSGEWQPRSDFDLAILEKLRVIAVEGDSLDPLRDRVSVCWCAKCNYLAKPLSDAVVSR